MPAMKFTKMHGLGNDYVFVNCFEEQVVDASSLARAVWALRLHCTWPRRVSGR